MPAPSRTAARSPARQRGSSLAQIAIVLASIGVIALALLQVYRP